MCLYLFSFTNYGKLTARKLYEASFKTQEYLSRSTIMEDEHYLSVQAIQNVYIKNRNLSHHADINHLEGLRDKQSSRSRKLLDNIVLSEDGNKYPRIFCEYLLQKRTLLGCEPCLYPHGYTITCPSYIRKEPIILAPGRFENMMLYLCHNHPLFSCFYFIDGSRLGAHGHRILYIGKDVVVFVLFQFSNMLLEYVSLSNYGLGVFINLFIITPVASSVGLLLQYLYTCPFTENIEFKEKYAAYESTILLLGRAAIVPLLLLMILALFFSCLFSVGHRIPLILLNYFIFVQFYGIVLTTVKSFLLFTDDYYYRLSFFGIIEILCIGNSFVERIVSEKLVPDVDFACRVSWYLAIIKVETILHRGDAFKAKWKVESQSESTPKTVAIEMFSDDSHVENPVEKHRHLEVEKSMVKRESNLMSFGNIYEDKEDSAPQSCATSNPVLESNYYSTRNQLHNLATRSNNLEDDLLYADYQKTQTCDSSTGDYSNNQTFEEWKLQRKEFKKGATYLLTYQHLLTYLITYW